MKSVYKEILLIERKREENIEALNKCRAESDSNTAFIWTDDEFLAVDRNDIRELESAMRFKAEHIHAKADPELFAAVADALIDFSNNYKHLRIDCERINIWQIGE